MEKVKKAVSLLFLLVFALKTAAQRPDPCAALEIECVNGRNPITGEPCGNPVTSAVPFLTITPDSRAGAMGETGLATEADAASMHHNPSKMAFSEQKGAISATYTPWMRALGLQDVYLAYLGGFRKIGERQAVGFGVRYFSLGEIQFTDDFGVSNGRGRPNEFEIAVGYSRQLGRKFAASLAPKFILSDLASGQLAENTALKKGKSIAADLSFFYKTDVGKTGQNLSIGLNLSNLGSKIAYSSSTEREFIPANLGLGASLLRPIDAHNSLRFSFDAEKLLVPTPRPCDADMNGEPDFKAAPPARSWVESFSDAPGGFREELSEIGLSAGFEYWYDRQFAVRAGYFFEAKEKGDRRYFTVGLGLKYQVFGIDFSYLVPTTNGRNPLDNTLRFSLLFDFEAFAEDDDEAEKK